MNPRDSEQLIQEGKKAAGSYFCGLPIDDMTREELLGVVAILYRQIESERSERFRRLESLIANL